MLITEKSRLRIASMVLTCLLICSGCAHKHEFSDATCVEPKTCQKCGEKEGEPLSHTVEIGKCSRCGGSVNETVLNEFKSCYKEAQIYIIQCSSLSSNNQITDIEHATVSQDELRYLNKIKSKLQELYEICGDYAELSEIKSQMNVVVTIIPVAVKDNSFASIYAYHTELLSYLKQLEKLVEMIDAFYNKNQLYD